MAETKYTGAGVVAATDYKYVKWVGRTKGGQAVTIEMPKAICKSNIDWTFAEKDDVVPEIEFEGVYDDNNLASGDRTEPWTLTVADGVSAGNGEILLGVGKINADEDPGAVEGRITQEAGRPKLKMNALQWLTRVADIYSGVKTVS